MILGSKLNVSRDENNKEDQDGDQILLSDEDDLNHDNPDCLANKELLDEHLSRVQTFDLIGFCGDEFVSRLIVHLQIRALQKKRVKARYEISHVGVAIRGRDIGKFTKTVLHIFDTRIRDDGVYIFESTASGRIVDKVRDVLGNYYFGAQLRPLKEVIQNYRGKIYWSKRLFEVRHRHLEKLSYFISRYNYRAYETNLKIMLANFFKCMKVTASTETVFCSELIARCLQESGIIRHKINPERVVPMDFYQDPEEPSHTLDIDGEVPVLYGETINF